MKVVNRVIYESKGCQDEEAARWRRQKEAEERALQLRIAQEEAERLRLKRLAE